MRNVTTPAMRGRRRFCRRLLPKTGQRPFGIVFLCMAVGTQANALGQLGAYLGHAPVGRGSHIKVQALLCLHQVMPGQSCKIAVVRAAAAATARLDDQSKLSLTPRSCWLR